jgi:hypothetical protein
VFFALIFCVVRATEQVESRAVQLARRRGGGCEVLREGWSDGEAAATHVVRAQLDAVVVHIHHRVLGQLAAVLARGCHAAVAALGAHRPRALERAGRIARAIIGGGLGAARGGALCLVIVVAKALVRGGRGERALRRAAGGRAARRAHRVFAAQR